MLKCEGRAGFTAEQAIFRDEMRKFVARHIAPACDRWEREGQLDREIWTAAGAAGLLCPGVPEEYGGLGLDFRFNAIVNEEVCYEMGAMPGFVLQSDILAEYLVAYGTEEQKRRHLPRMVTGETIFAIAMTEPGAGSDLKGIATTASRAGTDFVISGSKTYISNGQSADVVIVAAKTAPGRDAKSVSLILVEANRRGFRRGRNLDKIGMHSSDTSELFFDEVRVPATNLLGSENEGFAQLMAQLPQERLALAVTAQAAAQRAFDEAVAYTRNRKAFGKAVFEFQNTRFQLADLRTRLQVGWAHLDWAIQRHVAGDLTGAEASAAKYWHTETQWLVTDAALQLHGGAGYMNEYPIARLWRDGRAQRVIGGTSQIMQEIVSRSI